MTCPRMVCPVCDKPEDTFADCTTPEGEIIAKWCACGCIVLLTGTFAGRSLMIGNPMTEEEIQKERTAVAKIRQGIPEFPFT